jgi:hypothetical protein
MSLPSKDELALRQSYNRWSFSKGRKGRCGPVGHRELLDASNMLEALVRDEQVGLLITKQVADGLEKGPAACRQTTKIR